MAINVFGGGNTSGPVYPVQRSVRLRSSASAYFNRTPASAGSRTTWTLSYWIKASNLGTNRTLLNVGGLASSYGLIFHNNADKIDFQELGGSTARLTTTRVYRDPSAWYHIVCVWDSSNATAADRMRIYTDGVRETAFDTNTNPALNAQSAINTASLTRIGWDTSSTSGWTFDGYLTEVNFIDGQALTPSSFGSTNATTGVWQPIKYSGTYNTNGFYLPFTDNSGTTSGTNAGIGKDFSGNGNYWNSNNVSLTAGVTYDSMLDVPTLTSATNSNFATLNPLVFNPTYCLDGNLVFAGANLTSVRASFAIPTTGKWYFEVNQIDAAVNYVGFGLADAALTNGSTNAGTTASGMWGLYPTTAMNYSINGAVAVNTGIAPPALGGCMACAYDADTGYIWFGYAASGAGSITWFSSGNPATGANFLGTISSGRTLFPFMSSNNTTTNKSGINFGQRPFNCTPPSGFKSLNTFNLPDSAIPNGATQFAATVYTGTGSALSISNAVNGKSFQPDFVWIKGRSGATDHALYDSVRGVQKQLESNSTGAETTETTGLTAFDSSGFSIGSLAQMNTNTATYVAWQWNAGGSTVTNTSGSITSSVRANPTAGFSVVTYTGTGVNATVGHGLGVAPNMVIIKNRTGIGTAEWLVGHSSIGFGKFLLLQSTVQAQTASNRFNNTSPTSTVFSIGTIPSSNTETYVAYCFAEVAGFSKFGSYTGNGSADGTFVYLGFRPRWVLIKSAGNASQWILHDTSRNTYNTTNSTLYPNLSNAEATDNAFDILSNGLKIRTAGGFSVNDNGITYIYAAFAESPFKNSLAR